MRMEGQEQTHNQILSSREHSDQKHLVLEAMYIPLCSTYAFPYFLIHISLHSSCVWKASAILVILLFLYTSKCTNCNKLHM